MAGGALRKVADSERGGLDAANPVYDAQRRRMAFVRNGDVFLRDLSSGALTQLTRSAAAESQPRFAADGGVTWRAGNDWFKWNAGSTAQVASLKNGKDPAAPPKADALREQQLRTIDTLRTDKERRDALRAQEEAWRKADSTRAPAPTFLGEEVEIVDSSLSPDAHHLLVSFSGRAFGFIDEALASLGRKRRVVLTVNQFFTAGRVVAGSDLLTVLPRHFIRVTGREHELVHRDLPFDVPPVHVDALWHRRQAQRSDHAWLRLAVAASARKAFAQER